jgi:hypothetical protein
MCTICYAFFSCIKVVSCLALQPYGAKLHISGSERVY